MTVSIYDLETRATALANKYSQYSEQKPLKQERPDDAFELQYQQLEDLVDSLSQKAEDVHTISSRAVVAQLNAEIRRGKAQLRQELPKIHKLARKKNKPKPQGEASGSSSLNGSLRQSKCLSPEELEDRYQRLADLELRMEAIHDGISMQVPDRKGKAPVGIQDLEIRIDGLTEDGRGRDKSYYEQTETSKAFRGEFELAKIRQDKDLDDISRGVTQLKHIADDMGQELNKQSDLVEVMETKLDQNNADIRTVNAKLKHTLTSVCAQIRSQRVLCVATKA